MHNNYKNYKYLCSKYKALANSKYTFLEHPQANLLDF